MQIKVHPLFFVLALALVAFGQALGFAWTFVALILHELAHIALARMRGFAVKHLVLLPFGAMMSTEESFDRTSSVMIGLAGPVANLLLALIVLGLWWLFPVIYPYTEVFFYANLSLGLFNLLPIYPLDGSRVVLGLSGNRLKAIKGLQIAGIVASFIFMGLFIASIFFGINFSFGVIAVFLFYGAAFGTREETYVSVLDSASKNYSLGVEKKRVVVAYKTPILRLYHHVSSGSDTTFEVLDEDGKLFSELSESDLKGYAIKNNLSSSIGECIEGKAKPMRSLSRRKTDNFSNLFKRKHERLTNCNKKVRTHAKLTNK